ncbi:MAG: response regulator [Spirochaetota bacterium]
MPRTSVLIVEDHPLFSEGLAHLIDSQPLYTVVGEARNSDEARRMLAEKRPNLAIVDLYLGDEDGLELIKDLRSLDRSLLILVLSMRDERYYAERALRAGANGYIMKEEAGSMVLDAVKTVVAGKVWLSPAERERLADSEADGTFSGDGRDWLASLSKLSDRQLQIFSLIGKGLGTIEIASQLKLSTKTVDTHKEHLKSKLHCGSTQELRQLAIEWVNH